MLTARACLFRWTPTCRLFVATALACHLAWTAAAAAPRLVQQAQEPPATSLPLRLVGVVVDPQTPSNSACLVQCTYRDGAPARVVVGQQACEVAEVTEIRATSVVITNLLTKRAELLAFRDSQAPPPAAAPPPMPTITTSGDTVDVGLEKASLDYYVANLGDILAAATATPKLRNGPNGPVMEGFELTKIKEASIVDALGLRNGDVIVAVNDKPLDSLPAVLQLLGDAQKTPEMRMTVTRNGQTLHYVLKTK